ncbi:hypothetical protein AZE42_07958 [Rhizopogon vesiculosus]|uniref:VPS9 domain-containing protein n=1 Tax=Rhizopogon vesiculosus TaxID=180088 RepID=A0A1J8QH02_9AGAM|nr:hypothetical protein AZE42_07958 [Rhizopogon vesiculosus]
MSTRREALFPQAGSIGRAQGASITRTGSRDNLTTHPLLFSGPSPPSPTLDPHSVPKYVPYTPRQKLPTTSTTAQPPVSVSPQHQPTGGATSKLQIMNLKAAAQGIGLDTTCLGWAILEKLSQDGETEEWSEIWGAITKGKASLLLPLEPSSGQEKIMPEFVSDHVLMCDLSSRHDIPAVTLSGLRGRLSSERLTFQSSFPQTKFPDISVSSLAPLPLTPLDSGYPSYAVPAHSASLPIQVRPPKPPLPPRPTSSAQSSRLAMPFASLFGGKPPSTPPMIAAPLSPAQTSFSAAEDHPTLISAFSISRAIYRNDVIRDILATMKSELTSTLETSGVPATVIERVQSFASPLLPFVKAPAGKKKLHDIGASPSRQGTWVVNPDAGNDRPEELAEKFQEFYAELASHVRVEIEQQNSEAPEEEHETKVKEVIEAAERTLCTLFYDRLFLPSNSDDTSHDEALSSHIAALNLLDLGLEHLDVDVGSAGSEIDVLVQACGETLSQLDVACRSPGDKAAVLVAAHKLIVDGLSCLPPIKLKNDGDQSQQNTKEHEQPHRQVTPSPGLVESVDVPLVASPDIISSPVPVPTLMTPDSHPDGDATHKVSASPEKLPTSPGPSSATTPAHIHLPPRAHSPRLTISHPVQQPTAVSGDVLLPLLIFAVVKSNPPRLVSHLLFTQRYRNTFAGGEEGYCLINLMAVVEFLENVDLNAVGVGEGAGIVSTADLTPIPIVRTTLPLDAPAGMPGSLRGRVEQGVDVIAGSANKVISGVVDSSFGVLRSFLPSAPTTTAAPDTSDARWNMGLLRRESGFSIASLVPGREKPREKGEGKKEEGQRELVEVSSRPGSIRSIYAGEEEVAERTEEESEESEDDEDDEGQEEEDESDEEEEEEPAHDARSIRSFESMMSGQSQRVRKKKKKKFALTGRKSLTDRLAQVPGLSRLSGTDAHKTASSPVTRPSLLLPSHVNRADSPVSSRAPSPASLRLPAPNKRFMECAEEDLRVSEVGELLREYRRLVEGIRAIGGFEE